MEMKISCKEKAEDKEEWIEEIKWIKKESKFKLRMGSLWVI